MYRTRVLLNWDGGSIVTKVTKLKLFWREDEQYGNIQCIMVAHGIHKVPLSDQRNHLHLDFTMCTSRYFSLQSFWAREKV